ncbi:Neuraminyllactose-binding hemagglutinin [Helicobacter sp. NHP19-003]|uniref:Neuraminyllactose-binding hemagglutinin n=1 Tax=Helicobacter gastrocanis TaxID=2849641 RepID=A0ABN6I6R3_9HELI|nr:HpaA family protein [Helicobacter sp. NHP19-003]BCZ18289.1 Neuraminyllactose-binding hemagglutinin [Helicobacter sp. NHP19-003]
MHKNLVLLGSLAGLLITGCAMDSGNTSGANAPEAPKKHRVVANKGDTILNFNYPVNIAQEPLNHHTVGILAPHIQVTDNLTPYIDQFQDALINQIAEIFQKRGYQVVRLTTEKAMTPEQKHKMWSVLDMGGWIGILEDVKMNTDNPGKDNVDVFVDQSSGSVWFKFFEPETGRIIHNFGVEVGTKQAFTHRYTYKTTNSGGFSGPNIASQTELDKNNDDAIRKILNEMYPLVMKKLVNELSDANINRYRQAIEQIKK